MSLLKWSSCSLLCKAAQTNKYNPGVDKVFHCLAQHSEWNAELKYLMHVYMYESPNSHHLVHRDDLFSFQFVYTVKAGDRPLNIQTFLQSPLIPFFWYHVPTIPTVPLQSWKALLVAVELSFSSTLVTVGNLVSWISVSVKVLGGLSLSFEIADLLTGQILEPVNAHMMMLGLWNAMYVSCKFKAKFFLSLGFLGFSLVFFAVLYHSFFRGPNTLWYSGCIVLSG